MAETKYGKYVVKAPIVVKEYPGLESVTPAGIDLRNNVDLSGAQFSLIWVYVTKPRLMEKEPHAHYCDQILCFFGGNSMEVGDFGAEVELSLGEEGEKHIINANTLVYIPKGLVHCPLNFKRIDKPVVFQDIFLGPKYERKPLPK